MVYVKYKDAKETGQFVSKVVFHLHPTFNPPKAVITEAPFQLRRIGWGYFELVIEMHFKPFMGRREPYIINHMLSFEGKGI